MATIHDWGVLDGIPFVDTGLTHATSLRDRLCNGPLSAENAIDVLDQIAGAVDAAHAAGLVHRDINPSNIRLAPSGFASLTGFGTAVNWDDASLNVIRLDVEDCCYAAPECYTTAPERFGPRPMLDTHKDIYSLTCVLYACLTATTPFAAVSKSAMVKAHLSEPPPTPSRARPGLPPALDAVIARGMAKDPRDRYPNAAAMIAAARAALLPILPPAPAPPHQPRPVVKQSRSLPRRIPGASAASAIPGWAAKNGMVQLDPRRAPSTPAQKSGWSPGTSPLPNTGYRGMGYDLPASDWAAPTADGYEYYGYYSSPAAEADDLPERYAAGRASNYDLLNPDGSFRTLDYGPEVDDIPR
uniref:serine/threonine protein kinase n=1 Tax=Nocardia suismassiliense TaxID=2077092 RepID=UPI003F490F20